MLLHQLANELGMGTNIAFFEGDLMRRKKLFRRNTRASTGLRVNQNSGGHRALREIKKLRG
jgi:hypothetical protein